MQGSEHKVMIDAYVELGVKIESSEQQAGTDWAGVQKFVQF